jgi:hypothetical protein
MESSRLNLDALNPIAFYFPCLRNQMNIMITPSTANPYMIDGNLFGPADFDAELFGGTEELERYSNRFSMKMQEQESTVTLPKYCNCPAQIFWAL